MQIILIFTRKVFHLASAHCGSKTFWNSAMVYVYIACVAGAKRGRGGGREKGKGKGAPALRAYVFA